MNEKKGNAFTNNPIVKAIGLQKIVVVLVIVLLAAFFSIMSPAFRQYSTLVSLFDYSYYITFMAIGVTFCLITGGNDLSVGTGMVCYSLFGGYLIVHMGLPVGVGMIATILLGMVIGLLNAFLVAVWDLPPFIATLGTMMMTRGLGSILTGGLSIAWPATAVPQGWFRSIFKYKTLNSAGKPLMIPVGFILVLICIIVMSIFLNKSKPGRYIIAIGSNKEATRLSGINVVKYQGLAYLISGFFAGLAGIAYAATFQSIAPGTGAGLELDAIAGAIIGGTSMTGGVGTITGTLLGVFVMSLLKTGLPYIGLQANWQQIITGIVLIVAIFIDVLKNKKTA
ncbi:MAG: ABC transporter permease [Eubacteriales bacterium]|nr:ABC transporter permease [Eubacteriales bacterium]